MAVIIVRSNDSSDEDGETSSEDLGARRNN